MITPFFRFRRRNIQKIQTLGDHLRKSREEERWTLQDVEAATKIRRAYLEALEMNRYDLTPGEIYCRNFLKRYATLLQLNPQVVLARYEKEKMMTNHVAPSPHPLFPSSPEEFEPHPILNPRMLHKGIVALGLLLLFGYLGLEIHETLAPPKLIITNPQDRLVTQERSVTISGITERESKVRINGQEIMSDLSGRFQETVDLREGLNVLRISVAKKSGKENIIIKQIRVEPKLSYS